MIVSTSLDHFIGVPAPHFGFALLIVNHGHYFVDLFQSNSAICPLHCTMQAYDKVLGIHVHVFSEYMIHVIEKFLSGLLCSMLVLCKRHILICDWLFFV